MTNGWPYFRLLHTSFLTATLQRSTGKALIERMFGFCSVTVTVVTVKKWDTFYSLIPYIILINN